MGKFYFWMQNYINALKKYFEIKEHKKGTAKKVQNSPTPTVKNFQAFLIKDHDCIPGMIHKKGSKFST